MKMSYSDDKKLILAPYNFTPPPPTSKVQPWSYWKVRLNKLDLKIHKKASRESVIYGFSTRKVHNKCSFDLSEYETFEELTKAFRKDQINSKFLLRSQNRWLFIFFVRLHQNRKIKRGKSKKLRIRKYEMNEIESLANSSSPFMPQGQFKGNFTLRQSESPKLLVRHDCLGTRVMYITLQLVELFLISSQISSQIISFTIICSSS